ncbi:hypothetical protein EDB86DRAFT_3242263 [Lactarius hatsudake]|nr:hypothetical protein EDB86DRAFT_3242263 [Lactarius hatsudake]
MGWFVEKLLVQKQVGKGALDMPLCSRGLLRGIVNKGHTLIRVILLTQPVETVNDATWSASCAFSPGSDEAKCLEEIANALQTGEIELLMYRSESAPGQSRDYRQHCYKARVTRHIRSPSYADSTGTAARSISIHPTAQHPATRPSKSKYQQGHNDDATGTTHHMIASRIASGHVEHALAGGEDNKDVAIHLAGPPGSHHPEVRTIDGAANPHIALATVLGLSLVGVQRARAEDRGNRQTCSVLFPNWDGTVDVACCTFTNKDGLVEAAPPVKILTKYIMVSIQALSGHIGGWAARPPKLHRDRRLLTDQLSFHERASIQEALVACWVQGWVIYCHMDCVRSEPESERAHWSEDMGMRQALKMTGEADSNTIREVRSIADKSECGH